MRFLSRNWLRSLAVILVLPFVLQCSNSLQPDASSSTSTATYDYRQLPRPVSTVDLGFESSYYSSSDQFGDHLAVAQTRTILLLNTQDPHDPRVVQTIPWESGVIALDLTESNLYVVGPNGLAILDREDALGAPVGQLEFAYRENATEILVDQECFLGMRSGNGPYLNILDVEDVANPVILSQVVFESDITDLARNGDLLVVGTYDGAVILDVSDPTNVEHLSKLDQGRFVALRDGLAFLCSYRGEISAYDIRDASNPVEVGNTLAVASAGRMTIQGDRLYVRIHRQVEILDISDPRQAKVEVSLSSPGWGRCFVRGEHIWSLGKDLLVHEVSETIAPPLLGERELTVWTAIGVDDDRLIGYGPEGLFALPIRDPTLSSPVSPLAIPFDSRSTGSLDAGRLYTQRNQQQVEVRNLRSQRLLHTEDLSPYVQKERDTIAWLVAQGQRLYVFVSDEIGTRYELLVFEVTAAGQFTLAGRLPVAGDPLADVQGVLIESQTVYVLVRTASDGLLDILDISNVYRPKLLSRTAVDSPGDQMAYQRGYLYLESRAGLATIDVRDKNTPVLLSRIDSDDDLGGLVAKGNFLYGMRRSEMVILDLSRPGQPVAIASRGYSSRNIGTALFATDQCLLAVRGQSLEALPFHASQH